MSNHEWTGAAAIRPDEIERGEVVGVDAASASVLVRRAASDALLPCSALESANGTLALGAGDTVLVWWPASVDDRGVILGRLSRAPNEDKGDAGNANPLPDELVIEARSNLTLKCGEGSITIREDGRILIKGRDLVSHAKRMNRIRGGAVSIN